MIPDAAPNGAVNSPIYSPLPGPTDNPQGGGIPPGTSLSTIGPDFQIPNWGDVVPPSDPNANSARPDTPSTGPLPSTLDNLVQAHLAGLVPGWDQKQCDSWVYESFLPFLVGLPNLGIPSAAKYIGWLVGALKSMNYDSKTSGQYESVCKKMRYANEKLTKDAAKVGTVAGAQRYSIRTLASASDEGSPPSNPWTLSTEEPVESTGYWDNEAGQFLTNFTIEIDEEIESQDAGESRIQFKGRAVLFGEYHAFTIAADKFANPHSLLAKVYEAAGVGAVLHGKVEQLRAAVSTLYAAGNSQRKGRRVTTTDFGWNTEGTQYIVPSGMISATGFTPAAEMMQPQVDLSGEELAARLDLRPLDQETLQRVKKHIVEDLLCLNDRRLTYSLLGTTAAAILSRFSPSSMPYCLWLAGPTGAGKSYLAKLFMSFFGHPAPGKSQLGNWGSTPNFLQRQGYFHKDATFLIDDFKPEIIKPDAVLRLIQNYADRSGRGRLKVDATTNITREIRGLLVITGEDVIQQSPSGVARSVVTRAAEGVKDLKRGMRCEKESVNYSGVTSDFIQHILADEITASFGDRVKALRAQYYHGIAGQQNDSRIAGNLALLAAGFEVFASYFDDVWPDWIEQVQWFVDHDLILLRDEMTCTVLEQQASVVFWNTLQSLLRCGEIEIGPAAPSGNKSAMLIGKELQGRPGLCWISTDQALGAVNVSLRTQGRPELKLSRAALLQQLLVEGKLVDEYGTVLKPDDDPTRQVRIGGKARWSFLTRRSDLMGNDPDPALQPLLPSQPPPAVTEV